MDGHLCSHFRSVDFGRKHEHCEGSGGPYSKDV